MSPHGTAQDFITAWQRLYNRLRQPPITSEKLRLLFEFYAPEDRTNG